MLGDQLTKFLVRILDLPVDTGELADQLDRKPAAGLADQVARFDRRDERAGLVAERNFFAPPGKSSNSRRCSRLIVWVRARPSFVTAVGKHAQHGQVSVDLDSVEV
ncbi:MAG: hypothetical protein M3302_01495, partial [Actinomycetota bacterium]|nr:hypothetical protein [Actinomycetota bacterium]